MGTVVNLISLPNQVTQQFLYLHLLFQNVNLKLSHEPCQKLDEKRTKMTTEEVKSKIKALKNQIKQMKETDAGKMFAF